MHSLAISVLAGLAATAFAVAAARPMANARSPHFAEILYPAPGFLLIVNGSSTNATVPFQYRNGERADNTTCSVSLLNDTAVYLIASNVTFYNDYYVNVTLEISFANFTDGNYTLVAQEVFEGDLEAEVIQPFAISHNPSAPTATGGQEEVNIDPMSTTMVLPTVTLETYNVSATATPEKSASGGTLSESINSLSKELSPPMDLK